MGRPWFEREERIEAEAPSAPPRGWLRNIVAPLLGGYLFVAFVIALFDVQLGLTVITRPVTWLIGLFG